MPQISAQIILSAFRQPSDKALDYIRSKVSIPSLNWEDVWQEAHTKAFTVAKAMQADVLSSIRQMVDKALSEGITFDKFQRSLEPYLKLAGWWGRGWPRNDKGEYLGPDGKPYPVDDNGNSLIPAGATPPMLGSPWRLRTIYQTNLQTSLMAGRYKGMMQAVEQRPYWQYIAIGDGRTTALCSGLAGRVYRYDDPFWNSFYPPNHWGCRSRVRSLSDTELARKDLVVSESGDDIGTEQKLVSRTTGEMRDVATIKIGNKKYSTDAGWSYNPAKAQYLPDPDTYPTDIADQFVSAIIAGDSFTRFYDGDEVKPFPVGVLDEDCMKAIGTKSHTIWLSTATLRNHVSKHSELGMEDYRQLPEIFRTADLIIREDDQHLIFVKIGSKYYYVPVKTTADKKENYMTSFRLANDKDVERKIRDGKIVRDTRKK